MIYVLTQTSDIRGYVLGLRGDNAKKTIVPRNEEHVCHLLSKGANNSSLRR
jgi:hypothetical protein